MSVHLYLITRELTQYYDQVGRPVSEEVGLTALPEPL